MPKADVDKLRDGSGSLTFSASTSGISNHAPLDGVYAKLNRANAHLRDLKDRIEVAMHPNLCEFVSEDDGQPSKRVYRINRLPYIDPEWSLVLGDILTNARAALDHLAWQLVILDNLTPDDETQFPIYESALNRRGNPRTACIKQVTRPDICQAVIAVQPYEVERLTGAPATNNGLNMLNTLVNIDKHRLLLVVAAVLDIGQMHWLGYPDAQTPDFGLNTGPLKDGDEVAWFDFRGARPHPDFDPHLALEIRLNEGPPTAPMRVPNVLELMQRILFEIEHFVIGVHFLPLF